MRNYLPLVTLLFLLFSFISEAQERRNIHRYYNPANHICPNSSDHSCGFDDANGDLSFEHQAVQHQLEKELKKILENDPDHFRNRQATYTVPVVVHIIHDGGSENISDQRVIDGINLLNESFANTGVYDQGSGVNVDIEFCLARQDPDGNITNGITRTVSSLTVMDKDTQDDDLKALIQWDPTCYVNIWLVREIIGGVAGYAYFPGAHGASYDGIVSEAGFIGNNPGSNNVLPHEMGHYFGLYHTWNGGCVNNDCLADGDRVCDTPPDNSTSASPCNNPPNTCTTDTDSGFTTDQNDLINNFMDYGDWGCWHDFTQGQADRMVFFLTTTRASLLECSSCMDPCPVAIAVDAATNPISVSVGQNAIINLNTDFATQYQWYVDGQVVSTSPTFDYPIDSLADFEVIVEVSNGTSICFAYDTILVQPFCEMPTLIDIPNNPVMATALMPTDLQVTPTNATDVEWYINSNQLIGNGNQISYTFPDAGTYAIEIIGLNDFQGCNIRDTLYVEVACPPDISVDLPFNFQTVEFNTPVLFSSNATNVDGVEWYVDGMLVGNSTDLIYTFDEFGIFNLTVQGISNAPSCSVSDQMQIEVECSQNYSISVDQEFISIGESVTFTATGNMLSNYMWYVNGELVSTDANFTPTFNLSGAYEVYLVADLTSCTQQSESIIITVQEPCFYDTIDHIFEFTDFGGELNFLESSVDDGYLLVFQGGLIKVDENYEIVWSRFYNGIEIMDASVDINNGGYFVTYYGNPDILSKVMKIDEQGNVQWQVGQSFPFIIFYGSFASILTAPNGDVLFFEQFTNAEMAPGVTYTYLARLTPDGALLWSREIRDFIVSDALFSSNGDIVLSGAGDNFVDVLSVIKLDGNGDILWSTSMDPEQGGIANPEASQIEEYDNGNYLIAMNLLINGATDGTYSNTAYITLDPDGTFIQATEFYDKLLPFTGRGVTGLSKAMNGDFLIPVTINDENDVSIATLIRLRQDHSIRWARKNPYREHSIFHILHPNEDEILFFGGWTSDNLLYRLSEDGFAGNCQMLTRSIRQIPRNFVQNFNVYQAEELVTYNDVPSPALIDINASRQILCTTEGINGIDLSLDILSASICNDSVTFELEICNLGNEEADATLPLSFYDGSPVAVNASILPYQVQLGQAIEPDSCYLFTYTIPDEFNLTPYIMSNDNGSASTPFNFSDDFPVTGEVECNYINGLDSISLEGLYPPVNPILDLGNDTLICIGDSILLQGNPAFDTFLWQDGSTDSTFWADAPGWYWLEASINCRFPIRDSIYIDNPILPTLDLGPDLSGCQNDVFPLDAGPDFVSYQWVDGSTDSFFTAWEPGIYWVETTDLCGNVSRDSVEITIEDGFIIELGEPITICPGDSVEIDIVSNYTTFSWTPADFLSCNSCPNVVITPDSTIRYNLIAEDGNCFSADTLSIIVLPDYFSSDTLQICEGDSIEIFNQQVSQAGIYENTLSSLSGCDSTIQYVIQTIPPIVTNENLSTCAGSPIDIFGIATDVADTYSSTFLAANGCDSIHNITLTVLDTFYTTSTLGLCEGDSITLFGQVVDQPGFYQNTFIAENGCDSTHVYEVSQIAAFEIIENIDICQGDIYESWGLTFNSNTTFDTTFVSIGGCDSTIILNINVLDTLSTTEQFSICTGDSISIFGQQVANAGSYSQTFTSLNGCDSTHTIELMLLDTFSTTENISLCAGDTVSIFGQDVFEAGDYAATFFAVNGCDSTHRVLVSIVDTIFTQETSMLCAGDTITIFGQQITDAGVYSQNFISLNGCDSTHSVTVEILDTLFVSEQLSLCAGDSISLFGQFISDAGTYESTFSAINGCDSTHQVVVSIVDTIFTQENTSICAGETIDLFGQMVNTAGDYSAAFTSTSGCDSVHTISLAILDTLATFENIQLCIGDSVLVGSDWIQDAGVYPVTYASILGCDSTHYTTISMLDTFYTTESIDICAGETITLFGQPVSNAGTYSQTSTSLNGCDSTHAITVTVLDTFYVEEQQSLCAGDSISIFGQFVTAAGTYEATFLAANGCDSTHAITVDVLDTVFVSEQLSLCAGDSISLFGQFVDQAGTYEATFSSINGCDSTHQIIVSIVDTIFTQESISICAGESIDIFGQVVGAAGDYSEAFTAQSGCDSVHTITLAVTDTLATFENIDLCVGDSIQIGNDWITDEGTYSTVHTSSLGCDSTNYITIFILDTIQTQEMLSLCDGDSALIFGTYQSTSGAYIGEFVGTNGCDSSHIINLQVNPVYDELFTLSHCDGDSTLIFGNYETDAGIYSQTYTNEYGCDSTITYELSVTEATAGIFDFSPPCPGEDNGTITISLSSGVAPHTYQWGHTTADTNLLEGLNAESYTVTITGANGCFDILNIDLEEEPAPDYTLSIQDISCNGLTDGQVAISSADGILYSLDGSTFIDNPTFDNLSSGLYTLYLQDLNGCIHTTTFDIIEPPALQLNLGTDLSITLGESIQLQVTGDINLFSSYLWTPAEWLSCTDCVNPIAAPQQSQLYTLSAQTLTGCNAADSIFIQVNPNEEVYFPNVFSPNDDGRNDIFKLFTDQNIQVLEFRIFDRWGGLLYEERDKPLNDLNGWDGTSNQDVVSVGVYVYTTKIQLLSGKVLDFYGEVMLLR